ncbi:hypothetical protein ACTMU2_13910 [Cupriavidus basilensis]
MRNDYGVGHYEHVLQQAETDEEREAIEETLASMRARIDDLPDLPVSPLDTVRERIQALGYSAGEISGRSFETRVDPSDRNRMIVSVRPDERLRTIQEFNNGTRDAVAITRAGATGLSLHASEKFADQRQREMIELQIANNVAEQSAVLRAGEPPRSEYAIRSSRRWCRRFLRRRAHLHHAETTKLRKLSANTQSNPEQPGGNARRTGHPEQGWQCRDLPAISDAENPDIAAHFSILILRRAPSDDEAYSLQAN